MTRSDPYGELPHRSEKYASLCTDLHMGRKDISELWGFESFAHLHTLWLNNNYINSLEGLENNTRLLNLHCHGNKIARISETLRHLKFLTNLTLNHNLLADIEDVLGELRHLRNITNLDLFDNPITQEDNYRLRVIGELPWIHVLDKHEVTAEERKQAKKVLKKIQKSKNILNKQNKLGNFDGTADSKDDVVPDLSQDIIEKLKRPVVMHRVFLERSLMDFDPQRRGTVDSNAFMKVCNQYGLFQQLSDEDVEAIINRYTSHHQVTRRRADTISLSHSASNGSVYKVRINYPEFCRLIQPDQLRTMRFDHWTMDPTPELSRGAADLDRFVTTVIKRRTEAAEFDKRKSLMSAANIADFGASATLGSTAGSYNGTSTGRSTSAPGTATFACTLGGTMSASEGSVVGPQGIDAWLSSTIRNLVKTLAKEAGVSLISNGALIPTIDGMESISKVLSQMQLHGKIPETSVKAVKANVQAMLDPQGKIDINTFCDIVGCAAVVHIKREHLSSTSTSKAVKRKPVLKITWIDMPTDSQYHVEKEKFSESASYLDALLRSGKGVDTKALFEGTMKAATVATRLMASRDLNPKPPPVFTPAQIVASAPEKRADVVYLPRLLKKKNSDASSSLEKSIKTESLDKFMQEKETESADVELMWRKQFMALGLKKHELEFAIDRKKRSQASKGGVGVSSLSKAAANAFYGTRPVTQGEFVAPGHKSNWNTSTGTFLLRTTG